MKRARARARARARVHFDLMGSEEVPLLGD